MVGGVVFFCWGGCFGVLGGGRGMYRADDAGHEDVTGGTGRWGLAPRAGALGGGGLARGVSLGLGSRSHFAFARSKEHRPPRTVVGGTAWVVGAACPVAGQSDALRLPGARPGGPRSGS